MAYLIMNWVLGILALLGVTIFVPGFRVTEIGSALIAAGTIGLAGALLSVPLKYTRGVASRGIAGSLIFIVDLVLFRLSGLMIPGFAMAGFVPALSGAAALMAVNAIALRYAPSLGVDFEWEDVPADAEERESETSETEDEPEPEPEARPKSRPAIETSKLAPADH
ncbi:MAG: phage holin family protein [bacterium]|jgi:putative membrane protein